MTTYRAVIIGVAATLGVSCSMSPQTDVEAQKTAVEQVIRASIGWADTKDKNLLFGLMAQDSNYFIYHPNSKGTIIGFEHFREYTETVFMQEAFKATGFEIRDLRINLSQSGDVAWWSCLLDDFGEWDGQPIAWVNTRWTGVAEKRNGKWVIAQMHFSFASDAKDADAEGEEG